MPRVLQHLACFSLIVCALTACTMRGGTSTRIKSNTAHQVVTCNISSVTVHNGETLVELPVGSRDKISNGSFFRIYSNDDKALIKGTVKIDEVVGPNRSLARLVGELLDRNQPLAVDDLAKEIRDLGLLVRAADVENDARKEIKQQQKEDAKEQDRFDKLRDHYQRELKRLQETHEKDLVLISQKHEREIKRLKADHTMAIQRKDLERRADLAAMQASMKKESHEVLRSEQAKIEEKYKKSIKERNELDNQIQSLLKQQQSLKARIASLVDEIASNQTQHQKTIRAEIESREVLEARIRQLEQELAGNVGSEEIVLTNDDNRGETILERLNRISKERDAALKTNTVLRTQIAELDRKLAKQLSTVDDLRQDISLLKGNNKNQKLSLEHLRSLEKELAQTKEALSASALTKLETERALYDLAVRVMRLQNKDQSLDHLKQRLRQQYMSENK